MVCSWHVAARGMSFRLAVDDQFPNYAISNEVKFGLEFPLAQSGFSAYQAVSWPSRADVGRVAA